MSDRSVFAGQCLCGEVVYQVLKFEPQMAHCHCSMCRKFHGAAFSSYGEVRLENFKWVQGESNLNYFIADNGTSRGFCKCCGSSMTFESATSNGKAIEIALGTLDSEINHKADVHIYTRFTPSWYEIEDGLPQFSEGRVVAK